MQSDEWVLIECDYCKKVAVKVPTADIDLALESAVDVGWRVLVFRDDVTCHQCPACRDIADRAKQSRQS